MFSDDVMDASKMSDPRTTLICARLQLRGAKRHLRKGHRTTGVVALYDSVLFGMRYYISKHTSCAFFVENIDVWDAVSLFPALIQAGVFEDPLRFHRLSLFAERALWQGSFSFDANALLEEVEDMLTTLGVIPNKRAILFEKSRISH